MLAQIDPYKTVIDTLNEATILLTGSGKLVAMNPSAVELFGISAQDFFHQHLQEFLDSSVAAFNEYLAMCSRTRQLLVGAFSVVTRSGTIRLKSSGAVLTPHQGAEEALLILRLYPKFQANAQFSALKERIDELNDQILKRQRVEYDLRAQKEWLQVILGSIGDAVIITNIKGQVTFLNPIAEKMTGWNLASAMNKNLTEVFILITENTREPVENPVEKVLRERRIINLASNSILISRGGVEIPVADTAAPIHLNDKLEGVVLVFHDVSMKRNLERQLIERAERLEDESRRKNTYLAMLAHELRNPLGPINNAVLLLKMDHSSVVALEILERQTQHITKLVNGLLDVSRITEGKISVFKEKLDLATLVRQECLDFDGQFAKKNIELKFSVSGAPVFVMADATRLTQVVGNLLGNAQKFTPRGGSVHVSVKADSGTAILTITDTGPGLGPEVISHLFEPFAQGPQTIERSEGGLGLGLAMVKGIIDLHGGKVTAESLDANGGARFVVTLPLISHHSISTNLSGGYKKTILLIEDNPDQAMTMSLLLENLGGKVHLATDGLEGVTMAREINPDIVICDIGLPEMNGFEVARTLRDSDHTSSVFLVALTGYGQDNFVEQARLAGFDRHYLKPMKINEMQQVLSQNPGSQRRSPNLDDVN